MKTIITLALLYLLPVVGSLRAENFQPLEKPNIVVILADDLGYGDVRCLNQQRGKIPTPNLDRLAAQGMTFTDAHSGSAVCTPTRYGLLTGRYAWRTRLQRGVLDGGNDDPLIAQDTLTVPALLKQQGYATACVGKWHLGFQSESPAKKSGEAKSMGSGGLPVGAKIIGGPTTRGFGHFFGVSNARTISSMIEDDIVKERIEPAEVLPRLTQRACKWIGERAAERKPFFLYFAQTSPHTPIVPTKSWQGKSGLGDYADFVMQTDDSVGQVLAALEAAGVASNTLVIFSSDNGCSPAAGIDKLEKQGHFPSASFRGHKADIWEGGHRVPFFARWPGVVKPGSQSAQIVGLGDLMATFAEIRGAKLSADAGVDSYSILPLLRGIAAPVRETIVHHSINGAFAIRDAKWKLALCAGSGGWSKGGGAESPQLYDMTTDSAETKNIAAQNPEVVARLTKQLERIVADGRSTPGPSQKNDAPIELRKKPGKGTAAGDS